MTADFYEYSQSCLTADEEDAVLDEAVGVVLDAQPFDGQLKPLLPDDDILAALALKARYQERARELRLDLQNRLEVERRKAGVI